jgi:hypothetical protein
MPINVAVDIAQRIAEVGDKICTSIAVASELWFWAEKNGSLRLKQQVDWS